MTEKSSATKLDSREFVAVDPSKCNGCGICEYVCSLEKSEGQWDPLTSRIRVLRMNPVLNVAMTCRLCKDARCVRACPEEALFQSEASGVLLVDERKCKGCDWCVQACPHGGIAVHPDKSLVIACDLCGGEPQCVEFCPEEALELVSDDDTADEMWRAAIEKLPLEIERLAHVVRDKKWSQVLAEAEKRALRTSGKFREIRKRGHSIKKV